MRRVIQSINYCKNTEKSKRSNTKVKRLLERFPDYIPFPGFYDLREFNLSFTMFKKLWKIQDFLNHVAIHKEYYKKHNRTQWEKAKELSADYQRALFRFKHTNQL